VAVDDRAGRLDRQALLQSGVVRDVQALLAELRDTARERGIPIPSALMPYESDRCTAETNEI
jgi:hypothetical protein